MGALRDRLRDPLVWGNAFLLVKAASAAVIAWVLAGSVFGLAQPFLAPWAALLTVHATVYRTFARGAQQVASAVLGVLLAFAAGAVFGVNAAVLAVVLLLGLAAARRGSCATSRRPPPPRRSWSSSPATAATGACSATGCSTR